MTPNLDTEKYEMLLLARGKPTDEEEKRSKKIVSRGIAELDKALEDLGYSENERKEVISEVLSFTEELYFDYQDEERRIRKRFTESSGESVLCSSGEFWMVASDGEVIRGSDFIRDLLAQGKSMELLRETNQLYETFFETLLGLLWSMGKYHPSKEYALIKYAKTWKRLYGDMKLEGEDYKEIIHKLTEESLRKYLERAGIIGSTVALLIEKGEEELNKTYKNQTSRIVARSAGKYITATVYWAINYDEKEFESKIREIRKMIENGDFEKIEQFLNEEMKNIYRKDEDSKIEPCFY